jgi:tRNA nucleotidyltransferase/poly(A) polymerase
VVHLPQQKKMLRLRPQEQRLFAVVRTAAASSGATVRVAGGWVRDSLLGKLSQDIDLAVDIPPKHVIRALRDIEDAEVSGSGTVMTNPEKGKNIQVETCHILGTAVDLVPLRKRTNNEIGTPEEDVLYRDFTINALFFNLHSEQVEDFLPGQMGIKDLLENKVIRTPIHAEETMMDDPLRLVRAARFAAKMDFKVHEDIVNAAKNAYILEKLKGISRERFGLEVNKALESNKVLDFFRYLVQWNISGIIFQTPSPYSIVNLKVPLGEAEDKFVHEKCLNSLEKLCSFNDISSFSSDVDDLDIQKAILLSSYFMPMTDFTYPQKVKKAHLAPWGIIAHGLKLPHKLADTVESLQSAGGKFSIILKHTHECKDSNDAMSMNRLEIGQILRHIGAMWKHAAILGAISAFQDFKAISESLHSLEKFVISAELSNIWEWHPPISGDTLKKDYHFNGKQVGEKLEAQWKVRINLGSQAAMQDYISSCSS